MEQKTLLKNKKNQGNGGETMAKRDDSVKKKVPELRFKGFTDDWEKRKLGDIAPLRGGFAFKSSKFRNTGVPIVRISNILSSGEVGGDFAYYDEQDKDDKYILPDKSAVLAMSGATTGKVSILSQTDYDKVYQNQRVGYFQSVENIDYGFISTIVRSELFVMQLDSVLVSGAQPNVSSKEIDSFNFMIPSYEEQQKIGSFFKQLDETIDLHQRKLDLLIEQKKGFLQKMFPKHGEKVPELRFAGFADDWEERKLSDIADRFDNLRVPITASERKSGDTPYYGANGIQDYVEGFTHDGEFILVAEDGANDLKNYPVQYVNGKVWVNNHAHVLQGKNTITDNKFLMNSIKNFNIEPFLVGGGRAKLNADVMMKLNILLPTFDEQEKIGSFFKQLDDTIALHQRKDFWG